MGTKKQPNVVLLSILLIFLLFTKMSKGRPADQETEENQVWGKQLLGLTHPRSQSSLKFSRPPQENTVAEDDEDDIYGEYATLDDNEQREKLRTNILKELGFEDVNIPRIQVNISKEEYAAAYAQYTRNVRRRIATSTSHQRQKNAVTKIHNFYDKGSSMDEATKMKTFHFDIHQLARGNRIHSATIHFPQNCVSSNSSSSHINWSSNEDDDDSGLDVTQNVVSWISNQSEISQNSPFFEISAFCSSPNYPAQLQLVVSDSTHHHGRNRRSTTLESLKGKQIPGRDCSKIRNGKGKSCCRRSLKIKFSDLGISDVIIEPREFDAHVCVGRCNAKRLSYSTTHAMFQHIIHQTKGKKAAPKPCCVPTKLTELDVIHLDPTGRKLEVTVLKDAIVEECGCS